MYIHQRENWPKLDWNASELIKDISDIRALQGELIGKLSSLGFELKDQATIEAISLEIVKSNAIEGNLLNREDVRSSIARRLGVQLNNQSKPDRNVDGIVEMMFDAIKRSNEPLNLERLNGWHAAMFPTGYSGLHKISVGNYRNAKNGRMVVESANYNNPVVHFEAPVDAKVRGEMDQFTDWFNTDKQTEPIVKSGIAHLWFVTIHPYEDGNGRIARAITDMQLARTDQSDFRFYSMSDQIEKNRKEYYKMLEKTQKGDLNITSWLKWHCDQIKKALEFSKEMLSGIIKKSEFWLKHQETSFNDRQRIIINKLFDGFEGKLQVSKYAKICKCSEDSALRDIKRLMEKDVLEKGQSGGRSSYYFLSILGEPQLGKK